MNAIFRMVFTLSMFCAFSGLALSYLKIATANRIEEQVLTYVQSPAILSVFPDSSNDPLTERKTFTLPTDDARTVTVFPYKKDGKLIGVALENFGTGYGGDIGVMAAFRLENNALIGIGVTTMKETPGIGTKVLEHSFTKKFINIPSETVELTSSGGTIDAISGATISTVGVVRAVQKATKDYLALKDEFISTWK